jgi:hypothetical protein
MRVVEREAKSGAIRPARVREIPVKMAGAAAEHPGDAGAESRRSER